MPTPEGYTAIKVHKDDRNKARELKEARGQTWREFLTDAADPLDPDN